MKQIIFSAVVLIILAINALAADYKETMSANIQKMNQATSVTELTGLANQFSRIAQAEKGEWLPGYYAAYCYVRVLFLGNLSADEKHKYLDMAQDCIDNTLLKAKNESEIYTLQALVYQLRITDESKGYQYSVLSTEALAQAEKLNPENPRIYYLRGSNTFYTPKNWGGGPENAKPFLEKAAKMFETANPACLLSPAWGKEHTLQLLEQCKAGKQ